MSLLPEIPDSAAPYPLVPDRPGRDPFRLSGAVGRFGANARDDVVKAQILLANAGYLELPPPGLPTGWPGGGLERALLQFQKDSGLEPDGTLLPLPAGGIGAGGEGETLAALQDRIGDRLQGRAAPTPDEVDAVHAAGDDSGAREGGSLAAPGIVAADEAGRTGAPVGVLRDAPAATALPMMPGQQLAQAAPTLNPIYLMPPAGQTVYNGEEGAPPSPYPQEAPVVQAAARELDKRLGYAAGNLRSLLDVAAGLQGQGARRAPGPDAAQQAAVITQDLPPAPPSRPLAEPERKATTTPPLVPPQVDDRVPGRPAAAPEIPDEKLIPPEMQKWYGGLEPFDQELAKELLRVFNNPGGRRGVEATRLGNADMVKEIMEYFKAQRPDIAGNLEHVFGSRLNGAPDGAEMQEEYIRGRDSQGTKGVSWPDATIRYLVTGMEPLYLRLFTGKTLKSDPLTGIRSEREQVVRAEYNDPGHVVAFAPKLLADRPGGMVSPEARAVYQPVAREIAAGIGQRFEALLKTKGRP